MIAPDLEAKFWKRVARCGSGECWPWTGARTSSGYGRLRTGSTRRMATRLSWEIANGSEFPAGKIACHTCDNPPCVNPAHIWAGTYSENSRDMFAKGRHPGFKQPGAAMVCVKCGHLRTDDYVETTGYRKCRACNHARSVSNQRRRAALKAASA